MANKIGLLVVRVVGWVVLVMEVWGGVVILSVVVVIVEGRDVAEGLPAGGK